VFKILDAKKARLFLIAAAAFFVSVVVGIKVLNFFFVEGRSGGNKLLKTSDGTVGGKPQISAWIAWWDGEKAYKVIEEYPEKFKIISPVWFMVGKDYNLEIVSKEKKEEKVARLHELGITVYPSLGSELSSDEFGEFINDEKRSTEFINDLLDEAVRLKVDGLDIDLEAIKEEDKDKFSDFVKQLAEKVHASDLKISVTIHARTNTVRWEGVLGQDIKVLAAVADEVRIMTYDYHSPGGEAGPIAPFNWMKDVANYNMKLIDKEKIVIGIPSYGYVWTKDDTIGYQYSEFMDYMKGLSYEETVDTSSGEKVIEGRGFEGWLSDSSAMQAKIKTMQSIGFNKFVIWHLGGIDEQFFDMSF
jgi:spore germination protein